MTGWDESQVFEAQDTKVSVDEEGVAGINRADARALPFHCSSPHPPPSFSVLRRELSSACLSLASEWDSGLTRQHPHRYRHFELVVTVLQNQAGRPLSRAYPHPIFRRTQYKVIVSPAVLNTPTASSVILSRHTKTHHRNLSCPEEVSSRLPCPQRPQLSASHTNIFVLSPNPSLASTPPPCPCPKLN